MSNSTAMVAHNIEQEIDRLLIPFWYYADVACIALTLYEYLLTFNAERQVIWGRRLNLPNLLFLLNRYLLLLYSLSLALWNLMESWRSDKMCEMSGILNYIVVILIVLVSGVFSSLRIHAINGQRWFWTSLMLMLSCASIPYNLAALLVSQFYSFKGAGVPTARGCYEVADRLGYASWNRGAVAVQTSSVVSSAIDVGITWYRTKDIVSVQRTKVKQSLASSMLQSGIMYCLVDLVFNTTQFYFLVARATSFARFLITIESILMSRFILNLRLLDSQDSALGVGAASGLLPTLSLHWPASQSGRVSMLILGNIGAPLDVNGESKDVHRDENFLHRDGK